MTGVLPVGGEWAPADFAALLGAPAAGLHATPEVSLEAPVLELQGDNQAVPSAAKIVELSASVPTCTVPLKRLELNVPPSAAAPAEPPLVVDHVPTPGAGLMTSGVEFELAGQVADEGNDPEVQEEAGESLPVMLIAFPSSPAPAPKAIRMAGGRTAAERSPEAGAPESSPPLSPPQSSSLLAERSATVTPMAAPIIEPVEQLLGRQLASPAATPAEIAAAAMPGPPHQVATPPPTASVQAPRLVLGDAFGERLGVAIARRVQDGAEELSVRMDPAELGRIEVRLGFDEGGSLRAVVSADSSMVLDTIRRDMGDISRALGEAGVRTDAQSFRFDRGGAGSGGGASADSGSSNRGWQGGGDRSGHQHQPREGQYRPARRNGRLDLMA